MNSVTLDDKLFADFCAHLSSSLNAIDVVDKARQLANPDFDPNRDDPIMLAVFGPKMITRLVELKYPEFVLCCVRNLRLLESCADVFLSELEPATFDLFVNALAHLTQDARIEINEKGFVLHSAAIIADLIISPIGRLHQETLKSLDHFTRMIAAVGGDPNRLFLNAKSPTAESQYVQIWVSQKLGIPSVQFGGVILVI